MLAPLAAVLLLAPSPDRTKVLDVAISAHSDIVVVSCDDATLRVLAAKTGRPHGARPEPVPFAEAWSVAIDPTGEVIAALDRRCDLYLWSWREEPAPVRVARLGEPATMDLRRTHPRSCFLEFSPTGALVAAGVAKGGAVLVRRDGTSLGTDGKILGDEERLGGAWFDSPMAWSGDGRWLAALLVSGPVLFDAETGARLAVTFDVEGVELRGIALNSTGDRLALGAANLTTFLFEAATGETLWRSRLDPAGYLAILPKIQSMAWLSFSPEDDLLAFTIAENSYAGLIDPKTGEHLWLGEFHGGRMGEPRSITWLPSGAAFFHTYVSGWMPLVETRIERVDGAFATAKEQTYLRSSTPEIGASGLSVHVVNGFVRAFDAATGEERWIR